MYEYKRVAGNEIIVWHQPWDSFEFHGFGRQEEAK